MLNGKDTINHLIVGSIKRHSINEWIFSRTEIFRRKSESSNYVTKADSKHAARVDRWSFAKKVY